MPIQLPGAVHGAVLTRFPPEPSWHLDIGHCKAALMNQFIAAQFEGRWILRFDDTNPKTCSGPCVDTYLQDMPLLGLTADAVSYASDYFAAMLQDATCLIESGLLYADDTPVEVMRQQRLHKQCSACRQRPVEASLACWQEMQAGSAAGQACCLRFKLQPWAENGALRDPVAFRVILEPHYRTGRQYKVYPTYDYACPWLDAAEHVTHALRTLEFRDRDCLYHAVQQAVLALHPQWQPTTIWEFPRIHMAHTPQAKSHQRALLCAGLVDGPADPRLPTLRGLMRAGCHPDALRAFLLEQVSPARKETYHSWDKLWTLNRRLLDPHSSRHMAVQEEGKVLLTLIGGPDEPEPAEVQWKQGHVVQVVRYKQVWVDQADAELLCEGDEITLLAWGNARITSVTRVPAAAAAPVAPEAPALPQQQQQQQQVADTGYGGADGTVAVVALAPGGSSSKLQGSTKPVVKQQQQQRGKLPPTHSGYASPSPLAFGSSSSSNAAAAGLSAAGFEGFSDVLALRDQMLQSRRGVYDSSSVASTAGSTTVLTAESVLLEQDIQEEHYNHEHQQQQQQQVEDLTAVLCTGAAIREAAMESPSSAAAAPPPQQRQQQQHESQATSNATTTAAAAGAVTHMSAVLNLSGDPKASKVKIHWLPALQQLLLPLKLVALSHPVLEERVVEEVDVVAAFNHNSRRESLAWGDPSLILSAKQGAVLQLQRKGLFVVDQVMLKHDAPKPAAGEEAAAAGGEAAAAGGVAAAAGGVAGGQGHASAAMVVPTGAEVLKKHLAAPGELLHRVSLTAGLRVQDVQQLVLFSIPDGHTKHEVMG